MTPPIADRAAMMLLATTLCVASATPLAAQDAASSSPASAPSPAQPTAPLPGPRLRPEWPRIEPRVSEASASKGAFATSPPATHIIRVSTLVLVLAVVILVLLIA